VKSLRGLTFVGAAVLLIGASILFASAAGPARAKAPSMTCYLAFNSACGRIKPTAAQLEACFEAHSARLARSCGEHLPHFVTVARRCEADAQKFCGHVTRTSSLPSCMENRLAEVGQPCTKALAQAGLVARRAR
jgi:hypothetical protein